MAQNASALPPALNALVNLAREHGGRVTVAANDAPAAVAYGLFAMVPGSSRGRAGFLVTAHDVVTLELVEARG